MTDIRGCPSWNGEYLLPLDCVYIPGIETSGKELDSGFRRRGFLWVQRYTDAMMYLWQGLPATGRITIGEG